MKEVEDLLAGNKREMDELEVPEELKNRMSRALDKLTLRTEAKGAWKVIIVASLILTMLISFNFEIFAYYGKKLIGYDQIMNGTLKSLNELGKGQSIEKSYTFKNGVTITVDGIMVDENQLVVFYKVKTCGTMEDNYDLSPGMYIKGLFKRYYMSSAYGNINDGKKEKNYVANFEAPDFYEKKLSLVLNMNEEGKSETGEITIKLDRNKAMGHTLKKNLNKTIKVGKTAIKVETILATPTKTVVKGSIQDTFELAKGQLSGERLRPNGIVIELIADGKTLEQQGGGMSTSIKGITFENNFDTLSSLLKRLQIRVVSLRADHDAHSIFDIQKGKSSGIVRINNQTVEINDVYESKGDTYVTITTEDTVILTRVKLVTDDTLVNLEETVGDVYDKKTNGLVTHTRTLRFRGTGQKLKLDVQRISYTDIINKVLDVPFE